MANDADLVIRADLLDQITGSTTPGSGGLWDVRGFAGAGKSILLRGVERQAGSQDAVVLVEMQDYFTALDRDLDQDGVTDDVPADRNEELRRFSQALSAVIGGLRDRSGARDAVEDILNDIAKVVTDARKGSLEQAQAAATLIERVRDEVNELIGRRTEAGGRVYVLVDTFELVMARPLGEWFRRLLNGLRGAEVVVVRRVADLDEPVLEGATALEVGGLTTEQVRDYLVRRLGSQGSDISGLVSAVTEGHALAVGLIADMAGDLQRRGQQVAELSGLIQQLEFSPGNPEVLLDMLIEKFIAAAKTDEPTVGRGLDCVWAVRRFDFPLLELLLKEGTGDEAHRLAERLVGYSFVTRRTSPGRPAEQYYVVHDHVRELGLAMLEASHEERERLQGLHSTALQYYDDRADVRFEDYADWFHYEDSRWTDLVREWLYHVANAEGQANGRLRLAKLFFDAFWWWGYNAPFPFCEELLSDWMEMANAQPDKANRQWGEAMWGVYVRWPRHWRRTATPEDLEKLKGHLDFLWEQTGSAAPGQADRRMRQVRALVDIFLALVEGYLHPHGDRAEDLLLEARGLFKKNEDGWNAAWVSYQRADLALRREDPRAAMAIVGEGWREWVKLGEEDNGDHELAANLHRVGADAAWALGDGGLALDLYARAALHAYKFQVDVGDPDIPPIDEYTQAFLAEMHERAADRLAELHAAGAWEVAREACIRIRDFFARYWQAADAAGTAGLDGTAVLDELADLIAAGQANDAVLRLFPPPPAPADLRQPDTAYAMTAGVVLYEMEDELAQPPGTPL